MRRLPALLSTAALVTVLGASLTSCSGLPGIPGLTGCEPVYSAGSASDLVTASGSVGSEPDVEFPTPLIAETPQVSTIVSGDGDEIPYRGTVDVEAVLLDGRSGEQLDATAYGEGSDLRLIAGDKSDTVTFPALSKAVQCAHVGDRLALVAAASEALNPSQLEGQNQFEADDTLVFVIDIEAAYLGAANGINQLPQDGMPTVVTAPDGQPGITVPKADAPADARVSLIKAGGGAKLDDGDVAVLHFSAWTWPTPGDKPADVDSTWSGTPISEIVAEDAADAERLAPGVLRELVGVSVGSQLLLVLPADVAYPGEIPTNVDPSSTLIFVVDVLGIQKG